MSQDEAQPRTRSKGRNYTIAPSTGGHDFVLAWLRDLKDDFRNTA